MWSTFVASVVLGIAIAVVSTAVLPRSASAYDTCQSGGGPCGGRWSPGTINYHDSTGWEGAKHDAIVSSAQTWHNTPTSLYLYYDFSPTGPYQASVAQTNLDVMGYPIPAVTWTYYSGLTITGAQTYLNTTWTWYTDGTMNQPLKRVDVRTVTTHEMGHWMFLNHPCTAHPEAVMCPVFATKWSLASDDVAGLQSLYP